MQFQLAGLASGFDWRVMIDRLMEVERLPQARLREDQSENTDKKDSLQRVGTKLQALKASVSAFNDSVLYNYKGVNLSDETLGITALAGTSAQEGSYNIEVTQLAASSKRDGNTDVGGTIGSADTVISSLNLSTEITAGTFFINGQEITIQETDTLQDVFDGISVATSGLVSASYDEIEDKVTLTSSSGEVELGGSSDSSNFLAALKLEQVEVVSAGGGSTSVSSYSTLGIVDLNSSIASSGIGGGSPITESGTITINGVAISFDADSESMNALMNRVNESAANVTMSYDSAADQFRIVNNSTGALEMPVIDSDSGLMAELGLDGSATVGRDLQFSIDGGTALSSRSNVISESDHGIQGLDITVSEIGSQTIGISRDPEALSEQINSFIAAFNDIQEYILEETKVTVKDAEVTRGDLAGNREISRIDSQLRSLAFSQIQGLGGDIFRLEHMGIDFKSGTSKLEIKDSAKLESALAANLDQLEDLFSGDIDGDGDTDESFATRMDEFIENFTADGGILDTQINTLTEQNSDIDGQIEEMERRLEFTRQALEASFIAMEEAQSNIQQQANALAGLSLPQPQ